MLFFCVSIYHAFTFHFFSNTNFKIKMSNQNCIFDLYYIISLYIKNIHLFNFISFKLIS
jgi:hypothetical protein